MTASIKISDLPAATALTGSEVIPVVQAGQTVRTTVSAVASTNTSNSVFSTLAQPSGSSLVGYLPAGIGAVTTTVQSKLREFASRADYDSDGNYDAARNALTGRADHRIRTDGGTTDRLLSNKFGESVSVLDFGADPTGNTDSSAAIQAAIDYVKTLGGTVLFPRGQYSVLGNISATVSAGVTLKGASQGYLSSPGDSGGTKIIHTGNNTCFDFQAADIWASVVLDGFEVSGTSTGSSAVFINYSDSWGSGFKNSTVKGYSGGAIVRLWNKTAWTEGFIAENLMLRDALRAFKFERTSSTGGTDSFYRFSARNVNIVPGSNGVGFHMFSASNNPLLLYGADIDVSFWFETGGAVGFFVGDYCRFVQSTVNVKQDGIPIPGATDNYTVWQYSTAPGTAAQSFIDVEGSINTQQGADYYSTSALASGSNIRVMNAVVKSSAPAYTSLDRISPPVRVKGARTRFGDSSQATNKTFTVDELPALSSYKITLTAYATNLLVKAAYVVSNYDHNTLSDVTLVSGYASPNVFCRVAGGGTGHAFSSGNGLKFDVVVNAATFGANVSWVVEIEML